MNQDPVTAHLSVGGRLRRHGQHLVEGVEEAVEICSETLLVLSAALLRKQHPGLDHEPEDELQTAETLHQRLLLFSDANLVRVVAHTADQTPERDNTQLIRPLKERTSADQAPGGK